MTSPAAAQGQRAVIVYAWAAMLVFSILPHILWVELAGGDGGWIPTARLAVLGILAAIGLLLPPLRPAWRFPAMLLVISLAGLLMDRAAAEGIWADLTRGFQPPPLPGLLSVQLSKLGLTLAVLLALAALRHRRAEAYLARGQIDAPAAPVRWLGFPTPEPWTSFGTKWLIFLSIGMVVILSVFGRPNGQALLGAARFIPAVVLLAVLNAFNEEVVFRSSLLATTVRAVGEKRAHILTAVLFGIMHYYGVPYGVGGVVLSTFMGWFLGKAMLETKGLFWPWLVHVVVDLWIFYFILAGSIVPGG